MTSRPVSDLDWIALEPHKLKMWEALRRQEEVTRLELWREGKAHYLFAENQVRRAVDSYAKAYEELRRCSYPTARRRALRIKEELSHQKWSVSRKSESNSSN